MLKNKVLNLASNDLANATVNKFTKERLPELINLGIGALRNVSSELYNFYVESTKDVPVINIITSSGGGSVMESPSHSFIVGDEIVLADNEYYFGYYRVLETTNDTFTVNIPYSDTTDKTANAQTVKMNDIENAIAYYVYSEAIILFNKISTQNSIGGSTSFKQGTNEKASYDRLNRMQGKYVSMGNAIVQIYDGSSKNMNVYIFGGNVDNYL